MADDTRNPATTRRAGLVIGGVSELYQGDLDLGRVAVQRLTEEQLGPDVLVEDFHYGAVAVAQRLQEVRPDSLLLIGAAERGRPSGSVERRWVEAPRLEVTELQAAVGDAVTGYVDVDLIVKVGAALEALPPRIVAVEVEPARMEPSERLSDAAAAALEEVLDIVRSEVRRTPVMLLAAEIRSSMEGAELEACTAVAAMRLLLGELARADRDGHWGSTFSMRDRLKLAIAEGQTGEGMSAVDWALWWALIEELDRLQANEGALW